MCPLVKLFREVYIGQKNTVETFCKILYSRLIYDPVSTKLKEYEAGDAPSPLTPAASTVDLVTITKGSTRRRQLGHGRAEKFC